MNAEQAARLATRIVDGFPGAYLRDPDATAGIYADRLADWDYGAASRAVERLIDGYRGRFPNVLDLREAYTAEGGDLPDAGRNMSPPLEPLGPVPTGSEAEEIAGMQAEIRSKLSRGKGREHEVG